MEWISPHPRHQDLNSVAMKAEAEREKRAKDEAMRKAVEAETKRLMEEEEDERRRKLDEERKRREQEAKRIAQATFPLPHAVIHTRHEQFLNF